VASVEANLMALTAEAVNRIVLNISLKFLLSFVFYYINLNWACLREDMNQSDDRYLKFKFIQINSFSAIKCSKRRIMALLIENLGFIYKSAAIVKFKHSLSADLTTATHF
jgi:hypothetical protein